jgi:multicomponent K+:H+ antiporter subunit E
VANLQVALLILGPSKNLRPGFVKVPIDLMHEMPITILASCVSLTPGTVSAEVYPLIKSLNEDDEPVQRYLLIHVLDLDDEQALIKQIKARYEAPLKEIFQC